MWDLTDQLPEARVTVGSGPEAGWNVQAPDVMPLHFELYWDGKSLWVGPPVAGSLTADGERVLSWRQLAGRTRLEFGQAAMLVESSQSIEVSPAIPAAASASVPVGAPIVDDSPTRIIEGEGALDPAPLESEATRMLEPDGAMLGPGLGGAFGGPPPPPHELKTQILDTEALGVRPSVPPAPPVPPAPVAPPPSPGGGAVGDSRPTLSTSDMATDVLSFREPASKPREVVGPGGAKFALPPIDGGSVGPGARGPGGLRQIPKRTWALLGVTVVVAAGALGLGAWKKQQRQEAAAAAAAAAQQAQTEQAQAHAERLRERIRADAERLRQEQERRMALVESDVRAAVQAARERAFDGLSGDATEEETEAALREAARIALEKLAVDATVSNRLRRALGLYEHLQRDYPRPEYEGIVQALRAKLECRRGVRRDGTTCS